MKSKFGCSDKLLDIPGATTRVEEEDARDEQGCGRWAKPTLSKLSLARTQSNLGSVNDASLTGSN